VGSLSSELASLAQEHTSRPRVYADANVPAGAVTFMRTRLRWDVLFVMEHDGLRRAPDGEHYRMAHRLRRTLITLDRDYLDDRRFPPVESSGVLVVSAPDEPRLLRLLSRLDRRVFRPRPRPAHQADLPLDGRKLHAHSSDWWSSNAGAGLQTGPGRPKARPLR
jgi:hypothetical protein